jgi:hypothetical protein
MLLLLTEAYHLPLDSSSIRFASDFGDGGSQIALSWSLGAILFEENLLPWSGSAETGGHAGGRSASDFLSILAAGALGGFGCALCTFFVFAAQRSRARSDRERPYDAQPDESEMTPIRTPAGADSAAITIPYRIRSE